MEDEPFSSSPPATVMNITTMNTYCVSDLWNTNLTWNTDDPDFTACFHKTILGNA